MGITTVNEYWLMFRETHLTWNNPWFILMAINWGIHNFNTTQISLRLIELNHNIYKICASLDILNKNAAYEIIYYKSWANHTVKAVETA